MTRPIVASIDVNALQHNYKLCKQLAPASRVMAVVKANAYGHSLMICCHALQEADSFGLLDLADAIALRQAGFRQPICLLEGFFPDDDLSQIAQYDLTPVIHSDWQLSRLEKLPHKVNFSVWLKLDTGMHRLGFPAEKFSSVYRRLSAISSVRDVSLMSHLACADEPDNPATAEQLKEFLSATGGMDLPRSLANSAAILAHRNCALDLVRPGIMLYGSSPLAGVSADEQKLRPVMTLSSEIIAIRDCRKGEAIGYGSRWRCPQDMKIGVVACGYGDGYPRHAPSGTPVMVAGMQTQLIGRVSMDMITVDLRGIDSVEIGSEVELWGKSVAVDAVAEMADTISYELLCGITERVKRQEVYSG